MSINIVDFDVIINDEENIVVVVEEYWYGNDDGDHLETQRSDEPAKV